MGLSLFLFGFAFGALCSVLLIVTVLRWTWRHKELLTELVREIYHVDLMPFICRIEGSLNVALMEYLIDPVKTKVWIERAHDQVRLLKEQVLKAVSKYEKYQK